MSRYATEWAAPRPTASRWVRTYVLPAAFWMGCCVMGAGIGYMVSRF